MFQWIQFLVRENVRRCLKMMFENGETQKVFRAFLQKTNRSHWKNGSYSKTYSRLDKGNSEHWRTKKEQCLESCANVVVFAWCVCVQYICLSVCYSRHKHQPKTCFFFFSSCISYSNASLFVLFGFPIIWSLKAAFYRNYGSPSIEP